MSILKFAILGAAVAYGITELTKKRENGTSLWDDLTENAPDWMEKAKAYASETVNKVMKDRTDRPEYSNFDQTL